MDFFHHAKNVFLFYKFALISVDSLPKHLNSLINVFIRIGKKLQRMEAAIAKAKSFPVDCNNVDKKLRQILDMTEDEANFHMKQSAFLYQLAVQTMPRSFHCLSMRLTVEHFKSPLHDAGFSRTEKYMDPALHHYVIFSKNILASSVVINSTVTHARVCLFNFHAVIGISGRVPLWY